MWSSFAILRGAHESSNSPAHSHARDTCTHTHISSTARGEGSHAMGSRGTNTGIHSEAVRVHGGPNSASGAEDLKPSQTLRIETCWRKKTAVFKWYFAEGDRASYYTEVLQWMRLSAALRDRWSGTHARFMVDMLLVVFICIFSGIILRINHSECFGQNCYVSCVVIVTFPKLTIFLCMVLFWMTQPEVMLHLTERASI